MYAYVYDLLTVAVEGHIQDVMSDISNGLFVTHSGQLHEPGGTVSMLGMMLQRSIDGTMIYEVVDYYIPTFEDYGLQRANSVNAPGTSSLRPDVSVELLS